MVEIACPNCGHTWDFKGKSNKVRCYKCFKQFRRNKAPIKAPIKAPKAPTTIADAIKEGNIMKIVEDTSCINAKSRVDILNFIEEMEGHGDASMILRWIIGGRIGSWLM